MARAALQLGCRHGRKLCRALCVLSGEPVQLAAAVMPVVPDYRIYDLHDRVQERSGGSFDGVVSEKAHGFRRSLEPCYFGVFYALSGYMAAYSWNIMWLDCIWLLPLILYGAEQLVREKKGLFYCITLGLSILSNYYISIMICIFMVMYVIMQVILNPPKGVKELAATGVRFGFYSLLAGGLAAVVLLPEIYAYRLTASGDLIFQRLSAAIFLFLI